MPTLPPAIEVKYPGLFVFYCPVGTCTRAMWSPDLVTIVRMKHVHLKVAHGEVPAAILWWWLEPFELGAARRIVASGCYQEFTRRPLVRTA